MGLQPAEDTVAHAIMMTALSKALGLSGPSIHGATDRWDDFTDLLVVEQGPQAMGITVTAGRLYEDGSQKRLAANTNVAVTAADATNPRWDLVVWDQSGATVIVTAGTPAATPFAPALAANRDIPLALVYVGAGVTTITNSEITDVRAPVWLGHSTRTPRLSNYIVDSTVDNTPFTDAGQQIINDVVDAHNGDIFLAIGYICWSCAAGAVEGKFEVIQDTTIKGTIYDSCVVTKKRLTTIILAWAAGADVTSESISFKAYNNTDANNCVVDSAHIVISVLNQ